MNPAAPIFGLAVASSAALAIWGRHATRRWVHYLFKPLTTAMILIAAFLLVPPSDARPWVLLALTLSLAGDIVLMFDQKYFALGLLSFLAALVCWSTAFTLQIPFNVRQLLYSILPAAVALSILRSLWEHFGRLRWPVSLYVVALSIMTWRAFSRFDANEDDVSLSAWLWGCLGAASFMAGDTLLARRRFAQRPAPYAVELGVYYLAQWCLAASMW